MHSYAYHILTMYIVYSFINMEALRLSLSLSLSLSHTHMQKHANIWKMPSSVIPLTIFSKTVWRLRATDNHQFFNTVRAPVRAISSCLLISFCPARYTVTVSRCVPLSHISLEMKPDLAMTGKHLLYTAHAFPSLQRAHSDGGELSLQNVWSVDGDTLITKTGAERRGLC